MQNEKAPFFNGFSHISWRYYNQIKKKAMDKKPGAAGLFISISIAFFVVIAGAAGLNVVYKAYSGVETNPYNIIKNSVIVNKACGYLAFAGPKLKINTAQAAIEDKWQGFFKYFSE